MAPPERPRPDLDRTREMLRAHDGAHEPADEPPDEPPETPPADDGGDESPETEGS